MTTRYRNKKFIKDLIIQGDNGKLYYIRESQLQQFQKPRQAFKTNVLNLLNQNVTIGAIPEPHDAEPPPENADNELGFCYLINLASLRIPGNLVDRADGLADEDEESAASAAPGTVRSE